MPHFHHPDPCQTPFCRALIALAPTPAQALDAFALRLLASHASLWSEGQK